MNEEIVFEEQQTFKHVGLWVFLFVISGFLIWITYIVFVAGEENDKIKSENLIVFLIVTAGILLIDLLFFSFRLQTKITTQGIYVRFFPFHLKFNHYSWDKISKAYVRQYNPLGEFGGWGLRWGSDGTAYNVSGNKGLQLILNNNKRLLIGTKRPHEVTEALKKIGRLVKP